MKIKKIFFLMMMISFCILNSFEPRFMITPAISPAGKDVCFSYLGDLWLVPASGGTARRLTASENKDWNPVFSPDGEKIVFNSDRDGWTCIYQIPVLGGKAEVISRDNFLIQSWFPDSKNLLVSRWEPGLSTRFFKLKIKDSSYQEISGFAGNHGTVSRNGERIIFDRQGMVYREAYQGSFNGDLWQLDLTNNEYTRLTETPLTEQYPLYASKDNQIFFTASDGSDLQLWSAAINEFLQPVKLTKFKNKSVREPDLAVESNDVVFELFDEIWIYEHDNQKSRKLEIQILQDCLPETVIKEKVSNKISTFAVSDDGKLVVFAYKFDLFAVPVKGGEVRQLTHDQKGISQIEIMPDNQTVIYSSFVMGSPQLFRVNITDPNRIDKLEWSDDLYIESITRSGEHLVVIFSEPERQHQLALADSLGNNFQVMVDDLFILDQAKISPDNNYLLAIETDQRIWSRNLIIQEVADKQRNYVFRYDGYLENPFWGKDRKSLFITRDDEISRIDLQAKRDFYQEKDHWEEILFPDNSDSPSQSVRDTSQIQIEWQDIDSRINTVISRAGKNIVVQVLDDSTFYYLNHFEKKYTLRKSDYFGENDQLIHSFSEEPKEFHYDEVNRCFYFISGDYLKKLICSDRRTEIVKTDFKYEYDAHLLNKDIFDQVWREFGKGFYDPDMHGINWEKSYQRYAPYLDSAYTPEDLKAIIYEMIGEVNASHTGFYPRKKENEKNYAQAYLGILLDNAEIPPQGRKISKVFRKSKLAQPHGIKPGDILISVDGIMLEPGVDLAPLLVDKTGEKIRIGIFSNDTLKTVTVKGISSREQSNLYYDDWVETRSSMVDEFSQGRIGYLHIRAMNESSYQKFLQDMFALNMDKEALIIDIRNNGGGYVHDKIIEVLTKQPYAWITRRYFDASKHQTPYKIWEKPLSLLINENSFSDAEIFPNLFRYLELGTIIGMPTSGSVIGTSHHYFMDGSSMRMPRNGWFTSDGVNMEGNGVQPDIRIEPDPEDYINDNDVQLKKAVEVLLQQLK